VSDQPWVVLRRDDLEALLDRAVQRGRELAPESQWMHADDVASLLGVERGTVIGYTRRAGLPCRTAGRMLVFRRDEVLAWLDSRKPVRRRLRAVKGGR
jgi:predicted DNA-binding transcriptional regulator AlpA